jgi:hypothetical protein
MALPTVNSCLAGAASWLGDPTQEVYSNTVLHTPFFEMAYGEAWNILINWNLPLVEKEVLYTLPANTDLLAPATAGITEMGEPTKLWERGNTSEDWVAMDPVAELPQQEPMDRLRWWKWEGDMFYFVPATSARLLKIEYSASALAPSIGNLVLIDGAKEFLSVRTASLIAPTRGMPELGQQLAHMALGPTLQADGSGGLLRQLVNPMLKEKQKRAVRPQSFRPRNARL